MCVANLGVFDRDVDFDFGTADALSRAFKAAATKIEGQGGSRSSLVATAKADFQGHFSQLFSDNARVAAADRRELVSRLREAADGADQLSEQARAENERRRLAREWKQRKDERDANIFLNAWDGIFGEEDPPVGPPSAPVTVQASAPQTGARQTPNPGSGGGGGGTVSSARPSDLRSFASGSAALDTELNGTGHQLRGHLDDFSARCTYGRLSADGVVNGLDKWLLANEQDVAWANTIAGAFEAAGGEGEVQTLSDAALMAALAAQGVGATRQDLAIAPAQAYGGPPTTGYSADPVNTSTGNFMEPEVDLGFAGAASALCAARSYNSLSEATGLFGPGWASVFEVRLVLGDEGADLVLPDGREIRFPRLGEGWDRAEGENLWLESHMLDNRQLLIAADNAGTRWIFTPAGTWLSRDSGPGTAVCVERDENQRITRLAHERGRWIEVEYAEPIPGQTRISALRASDGRRVDFSYDDAGCLLSAAGPGGVRRYRWNEDGLIAAVIDAAGVIEAENTYDRQRRVATQVSPFGRTTRFAYLPGRLTVVSDADGTRSNTFIADARGRLVGVVDGQDARQSMSYDRHGNLVSVTERDGTLSVHAYDERGRRLRTLSGEGAEFSYGYDEFDRPTTVVTGTGATVQYRYADDTSRNPAVIIDPEGGRTELEWAGGLLARATDPTGVTLHFSHDRFGDLVSVTNALGDTARLHRDEAGRVIESVSPGGARTSYLYDAAGQLASRLDADGALWRYEYGRAGQLVAVTDPLGARTTMDYGTHGELEHTVDPLGRAMTRHFDDLGRVAALELPDGAEWRFAHDTLSRLVSITDPTGSSWTREYTINGQLSAQVDPTGVRQSLIADPAAGALTVADAFERSTVRSDEYGRPVAVEAADGSSELATYDLCGRVVELVDGEGGLTVLRRDAAGRVIERVAPSGAVTRYDYDAAGRPAASTDPNGARTEVRYDAESRIIARTFPDGQVERLGYDAMGRLVSRALPGRGTSRYRYDKAGRLNGSEDPVYGTRRFRYDAAGQLTEAVNGLGGVTRYGYDERGRLATITDPLGAVTRRDYDQADRVIAETDPLGRRTTAGYDAAGRPAWQQDPDGRRLEWSYDAAGRLASTGSAGRTLVEVQRDATDRCLAITDRTRSDGHTVLHQLRYNRRGQLIERTRDGQGLTWDYDADGNRTRLTDPEGQVTGYRHDAAGRLVAVEHPVFGTIGYDYDQAGNLIGSVAGDLLQDWEYRGGALLRHAITSPQGVATSTIERDDAGRITAIHDASGTTRYGYDAACQLVAMEAPDGTVTEWHYDAAGRLVRETVDGVATEFGYDAAGQLRTRRTGGLLTSYEYDGAGRRTTVSGPGGSADYGWTDMGWLRRVRRTEAQGDHTLHELWVDALGELAQVDGNTLWWDTAEYAPRVLSVGGASVTALPGGLAAVDGSLLSAGWRGAHPTAPASPWTLASQSLPGLPEGLGIAANGGVHIAGLDWLGARAYDPATRGFLSVDPLEPVIGAGWAGNPYSYAGNDPLHAIDPLGLRPVTEAELTAYRESNNGALAAAGDWMSENWEYVAGGAMVVGGIALMATGVGGPAGMALISGGADVLIQKATTGDVNWVQTAGMAVLGGVGGGAAMLSKTAFSAATPAARIVGSVGINMGVNSGVGAAGGGFVYLAKNGFQIRNGREFAGAMLGGGVAGSIGGVAGPVGGSIAKLSGYTTTSLVSRLATIGVGASGGVSGVTVDSLVSGKDMTLADLGWGAATGGMFTQLPGGPTQMSTLRQMPYFQPSTLNGLLTGVNGSRLLSSSLTGASVGAGADMSRWFVESGMGE